MRHNPTGTVPWRPLSARSFFRDPVAYVRTHGDGNSALRLAAGPSELTVLRDPETVWRVLVTDAGSFRPGKWKRRARRFLGETLNTLDGEQHKQRRLLLQPCLERRRVAAFAPSIVARVERMQSRWRDGTRMRLRDEIDRLSLIVAGDVLLSTDLEPEAAELAAALSEVMAGVPRLRHPLPGTRQARALQQVAQAVERIVARRRVLSDAGDDLIGILLRSGLPDRTVRGEVTAFLLAAVAEPPSGLAAAWYLLGRDEAAERRFHDELDAVLADRPARLDDQEQLPYLGSVLREALRLYPPARHIDRCPVGTVHIDGVPLRAGSNVLASPLVTHHDARLYDRASEFVPERWLAAQESQRLPRGAYLPFGAGAHTCIGEPLARMIMTLTLATVSRRWRLRLDRSAPEPVPRAPALFVTLEAR